MSPRSKRATRRSLILARIVAGGLVVVGLVITIVFVIVRLIPGDPVSQALGPRASPEAVSAARTSLGLDQSPVRQFIDYVSGLLHGDLGTSVSRPGVSVSNIIDGPFLLTMTVALVTVALSVLLGVPLGLWAGTSRRPLVGRLISRASVALLATPPFIVGLVLILLFAVQLEWLPAGGWTSGTGAHVRELVLPAVALSFYLCPLVTRTVRQSASAVMSESYVEAALSRGVGARRIAFRHVLPNCMLPLITLVALNIGWLVSGAVVVEIVFALPGLGSVLAYSASQGDFQIIQGVAALTAIVVVVANTLADALYYVADPRSRVAS